MLKAIVFDFDGVILESANIKTRAFRELFKGYPEHLDAIVKFHIDNGGVSRYEKFKIIYRDFLAQSIDQATLEHLGEAFSQFVFAEILVCPFVPGAYRFLELHARQYQLFVASGTPQDELRDIIKQRELDKFFCGIYGSPQAKGEILCGLLVENQLRPAEVVFIGDAMSDYWDAQEASVPFIGRVPRGESCLFPDDGVLAVVQDFLELVFEQRREVDSTSGELRFHIPMLK